MRNLFANTRNVKAANNLATSLVNRPPKTPGMALIFSEPGLGKTEWGLNWMIRTGAVMVQPKTVSTANWFLSELVLELGGEPERRTAALYNQAVDLIMQRPNDQQLIIVDKIDEIVDKRVLFTITDLHDQTGCAFLLIGMANAERKLKKYPHIYSRLGGNIYQFQRFGAGDIQDLANQLLESVEIDKSAATELATASHGELRRVIVMFYLLERWSRTNEAGTLTAKDIKVVLKK